MKAVTATFHADLPIEASLSLPIPAYRNRKFGLIFFYASHGGPSQRRTVSAPYALKFVDLDAAAVEAPLERLTPPIAGPESPAQRHRSTRIGGSTTRAEMPGVLARLYELTDAVLSLYNAKAASGPRVHGGLAIEYLATFQRLAIVSLWPEYRAISPGFWDWMDEVIGADGMDRGNFPAERRPQ